MRCLSTGLVTTANFRETLLSLQTIKSTQFHSNTYNNNGESLHCFVRKQHTVGGKG